MALPLFTPMRPSIADQWLEEDRADIKAERAGMSDEQIMTMLANARKAAERGDYHTERELRGAVFKETHGF